ncbi:hypothetical protein RI543_002732 [Arxiozyma heterogenica]|uniref:Succinate dehydrogenase [ubiquinone] cytochrome b small subunit n=1 Tax=Arxiozyma heterogenica TaxID=278026 RepID=A0AAN7WHB3_9SACH|nr:hypothetical protein RI543_002732 [Kazachstania heterogenica]
MFQVVKYSILKNGLEVSRTSLTRALIHQNIILKSSTTKLLPFGYTLKRYQSQLSQLKNDTKHIASTDTKRSEINKCQNENIENVTIKDKKYKPPVDLAFNGSYQEDYQRIIRYTLIPLSLVPFYTSYAGITLHPIFDITLSSLCLWYLHYGFAGLIINKIPKEKYSKTHKVSMWSLYTATFLSLCGLYQLETENNGMVNLITRIWNDDESHIYIFGK